MFRNRILHRAIRMRSRTRINKPMLARDRVDDEAVSRKRKIEQIVVDSDHETARKKRNTRGNKVIPDRISDLPEAIIHIIFSYMKCTKDVARTTILSKKWKSSFDSYLTFDFDERWFGMPKRAGRHNRIKAREVQKKQFKSYVERSLRTRLDPVPCIDKFRLYVNNFDMALRANMSGWVCSALIKNVKELDIQVDVKGKNFPLPNGVLTSPMITSLKLSGSIVIDSSIISMSNLRQLSIKESSSITNSGIHDFETNCPLIEDLRLIACTSLTSLFISSLLKLKRVELHKCVNPIVISIVGPRLETFLYHGDKNRACKINLSGSSNLRNLTLRSCTMSGMVFHDFIAKYPLIEKLELQECGNIERVDLFSERLRSLSLVQCEKLKEVNIDALNLYNLVFTGHNMPFASVNVVGLREAKFSFGPVTRTNKCLIEYPQLFRNFDLSKGFKLIVYSNQSMKIYEEPKDAYKVQDFFSKFELTASLTNVSRVVDNWLRESHGRTIALISPSTELIRVTQMVIIKRDANPSCCSLYSNKCWRHYVENVRMSMNSKNEMHYDFKWKSRCDKSVA
ncbi:hypothetical protein CASFOL_038582 [Castilleja foliolosa]|uniref:F-box domain-containing protein n=1 Tax=Castilleja foliolosa TaxID=1961234 RepID=A0ABD3BLD5_9LAMI